MMRRPIVLCLALLLLSSGLAVFAIITLIRCNTTPNISMNGDGIILSPEKAQSPGVQNGRAYDKASLDVTEIKAIVVPEDALVDPGASEGAVLIYMEKNLGEHGYGYKLDENSRPIMTPQHARRNMGCAFKTEGSALIIATYGEWAHKEGSAVLNLLIRVPSSLTLVKKADLSGENSVAQGEEEDWREKNRILKINWYGPACPNKKWTAVPSEPDPQMTARVVKKNRHGPPKEEGARP